MPPQPPTPGLYVSQGGWRPSPVISYSAPIIGFTYLYSTLLLPFFLLHKKYE